MIIPNLDPDKTVKRYVSVYLRIPSWENDQLIEIIKNSLAITIHGRLAKPLAEREILFMSFTS